VTETVGVGGRELRLSNLDKELYPGFAKAAVIAHYVQLAPVLLPHLRGRPVTLRRWPNGVGAASFVQKHAVRDSPDWVRTELVPGRSSDPVRHAVLDELASLVWAANLAALELHVPQWRFDDGGARQPPDLLVFDLDPGPPADVLDCCRLAVRLNELLAADGLAAWVKTSGSVGLHVMVPIHPGPPSAPSAYAKRLAQQLAEEQPKQVLWQMTRDLRAGKVFVDWSQNNPAKTTVAPYSLRGKASPTVSTPLTWTEVATCRDAAELVFTPAQVHRRVDEHGDLMADLGNHAAPLPG
jgi:bifunctional non-homologous end joining protein LigD